MRLRKGMRVLYKGLTVTIESTRGGISCIPNHRGYRYFWVDNREFLPLPKTKLHKLIVEYIQEEFQAMGLNQ